VQSGLKDLNTPYTINARMVRGLDYYTRTAFEVKTSDLGAQNAVAGGGRYNGLVNELGGPDVPGIGFAVGFERLVSCLPSTEHSPFHTDIFVAALGEKAQKLAFEWIHRLRVNRVSAEMDYADKSLKAQLKKADKLNSSFTLILGDKEIETEQFILRNMKTKDQEVLPLEGLLESLMKRIKER